MPFDGSSLRHPLPPRRDDVRVRQIMAGWRPIVRCPEDRGPLARAARALSRRFVWHGGE